MWRHVLVQLSKTQGRVLTSGRAGGRLAVGKTPGLSGFSPASAENTEREGSVSQTQPERSVHPESTTGKNVLWE